MHLPIPDRVANRILDHAGVVSVSKAASGQGRPIVIVGFRTQEELARAERAGDIPKQYGDVEIRFEVRGSPTPLSQLEPALASRQRRVRPVPMGMSAGHVNVTAGSSSWLLTNGSEVFMASNRHVYAPTRSNPSMGDPIVQPGRVDGGNAPEDTVAHLAGMIPPADGFKTDLAWGRPVQSDVFDNLITGTDPPADRPVDPSPGMGVWKSGRTTGVTSGQVKEVELVLNDVAGARMERQFTTTALSQGGDSGSPFFVSGPGSSVPVGILWGAFIDGNGGFVSSIGSPATAIEAESGMTILTPQVSLGGLPDGAWVIAGGLAAAYVARRR